MTITIILAIIIIVGIALYKYATIYNLLGHYKTRIEVAENTIDENLRKKFDTICEINIEIKKECKDKDYLKEYLDLKDKKTSNYEVDRKLTEAMNLIKELQNDHKKLNNANLNKMIKEIKELDEQLTAAKNFFNKNTSTLNGFIRKTPNNIVAGIHKFKIKPFFDNKNMQDAVIDDFKL